MTSFGYWQGEAAKHDKFVCMLCFDWRPIEEAFEDEYGDKWDTCKPCEAIEQEMIRKEANDPSSSDAGRARTDPR